jgi:hypothetical protein
MTAEGTRQAKTQTRPASASIRLLAWVLALGSVAFAVVNVVFESTGRFEDGPFAEYAAGLSITNWIVAALKVLGAGVAVLSVAQRSPKFARLVNILIWGAAGVLTVYSLGSVAQAIGLATGLWDTGERIDLAGVAYVLAFLLAALGFTSLATSHTRRAELGAGPAILGTMGGVVLLGIILIALPALLVALEIMPSS